MKTLSEYTNVYRVAIYILRSKGFQVWYDHVTNMVCAEKEGWDFAADNPCSLLGLVSIAEYISPIEYKEYWWRLADANETIEKLPSDPLPYSSVMHKR